jgi:hypothetical protein
VTIEIQEYSGFLSRRAHLQELLDEIRLLVDEWVAEWIAAHPTPQASFVDLAFLEGMLADRRHLLNALASLDEEFVAFLLGIRNEALLAD